MPPYTHGHSTHNWWWGGGFHGQQKPELLDHSKGGKTQDPSISLRFPLPLLRKKKSTGNKRRSFTLECAHPMFPGRKGSELHRWETSRGRMFDYEKQSENLVCFQALPLRTACFCASLHRDSISASVKWGEEPLPIPPVSMGPDEVKYALLEGTGRNFTSKFLTQDFVTQRAEPGDMQL